MTNTKTGQWVTTLLVPAIIALAAFGCVKRKETITVKPDGSMHWWIEVEGDREDMENGAPALAKADGWVFKERVEKGDDDKQKVYREAVVTIPAGQPIPSTYPTADAEGEALAMRHATTVTVERTADGTLYHFKRVCEPRPSAFVDVWWNSVYEDYRDVDPDDMSESEARKFVDALVEVERHKQQGLIRRALRNSKQSWPQLLLLDVLGRADSILRDVDTDEILHLLVTAEDDSTDDSDPLAEIAQRVDEQIDAAVDDALRNANLSKADVRAFNRQLKSERRRYAITEDYHDDGWEISVEMPGEILGHNGDKIENGRVVWERNGEHFYDRVVEMLVTSRVSD